MKVTFSDNTQMEIEDKPFSMGQNLCYFSSDRQFIVVLLGEYERGSQAWQLNRLEKMVGLLNPVIENPHYQRYFPWPNKIVVAPKVGWCAPVLHNFTRLDFYFSTRLWKSLPDEDRGTWNQRVLVAYHLSKAVNWLHTNGLVYADLSPINILVNLKEDRTVLIFHESIPVTGFTSPFILYSPNIRAPEINMGDAVPSINTDIHTLAVLIYQIFLFRNPLQGPKVHHKDPEKDEQLTYGSNPLYIEHPTDRSNRPDRLPFSSEMLTPLMRELFQRAFIDGLHNPSKRPSAAEWEAALLRMIDQIVICSNPDCKMKAYVAPDNNPIKCSWCQTPYQAATELPIISFYRPGKQPGDYEAENWSIVGSPNRGLAMHHIDPQTKFEPGDSTTGAHFELEDNGSWILVNEVLGDARIVDGTKVLPFKLGDRIQLKSDLKILMGPEQGYRAGYIQMRTTITKPILPSDAPSFQSENKSNSTVDAVVHPIDCGSAYIPRMPVYFLLECGDSMSGAPIMAVKQGVQLLHNELMGQPQAVEIVQISVIAYSTFAQQIVPLTPITDFVLPPLVAGGSYNLGNALRFLVDCIQKDRVEPTFEKSGDYRAIVLWITADEPTDDWMKDVEYLKENTKRSIEKIVAIRVGDGVDTASLNHITPNVFLMEELTSDQLHQILSYDFDRMYYFEDEFETSDSNGIQLPPVPEGFEINL